MNNPNRLYGFPSPRAGRVVAPLFLLSLFLLSGCKLQYLSEDFRMTIRPDGSGTLTVNFRDFGSGEETAGLRNRDLEQLKEYSRDEKYIDEAAAKGVTITHRRLEFVNYAVGGVLEATAKEYQRFFDALPLYTWEEDGAFHYLTPVKQTVLRADLSEGGRIVKRKGKIAFRWPVDATDIGFTADYQTAGASFRIEFQREFNTDK
ncbi:MAG: hypothetical protein HQK87_09225 [Nitrospinae bacterium]|nr:hypothetical protein [Nitrospinota bacterium]